MDDEKTRTRQRILQAAAGILEREGAQAVSTRSVAAAAGIRAASLYQLFGDKDALLAALAVHGFDLYLAEKHELRRTDDPVDDLRRGWDMHVDFGLRHPAFYVLMFGTDRPGRAQILRLVADPARARDGLGWTAATSLPDGLAATVRAMEEVRVMGIGPAESAHPSSRLDVAAVGTAP